MLTIFFFWPSLLLAPMADAQGVHKIGRSFHRPWLLLLFEDPLTPTIEDCALNPTLKYVSERNKNFFWKIHSWQIHFWQIHLVASFVRRAVERCPLLTIEDCALKNTSGYILEQYTFWKKNTFGKYTFDKYTLERKTFGKYTFVRRAVEICPLPTIEDAALTPSWDNTL